MNRGDAPPAAGFFWLLALLFTAAAQIADGATQTLFLSRVGPEQLPLMFSISAVLDLLVAAIYIPLAARLGHGRTLTLILSVAAVGALLFYLLSGLGGQLGYGALFVLNEAMMTLLKIHWGVYLLGHFSADSAARRLPVITTGARLGAVVGGLAMTSLAGALGPRRLLLVSSALYFLSALFTRTREPAPLDEERRRRQDRARELAAGRFTHLRRGMAVSWRSPLLRSIALATALMVLSRYGLRYLYSARFAATFSETELAAFLGLYFAVANGITILMQLTLLGRVLGRWGITAPNLLYALAVALTFLLLGFWPGLILAVVARFVESELKDTVKTPLSILFYSALPTDDRPAGRAFVLGLVVPLATLAASASLQATLGSTALLSWGLACACCYTVATHLQNRAFSREATVKDLPQDLR